jgi:hypothetical protein
VKQKWENELKKFKADLKLARIDPIIIEGLIDGMQHWREGRILEHDDELIQQQV